MAEKNTGDADQRSAVSAGWDDDENECCHFCGGDGFVFGEAFEDPLWYDAGATYKCTCCGGSGKAEDVTWW